MPEMHGFQATAAIRDKGCGTERHIPIVSMTAHALKEQEDRCLERGMDAYVSKRIRSAQLHEVIEKLLKTQNERPQPSRQGEDTVVNEDVRSLGFTTAGQAEVLRTPRRAAAHFH